jgi:hypothetical protein
MLLGRERQDATLSSIKLQNERFRDLYSSPHIVLVIKSRKTNRRGGTGHVARTGEMIHAYGIYSKNLASKDPL